VSGLPLASALIDLLHDHAEGAGQHKSRGRREQPLFHLGADIGSAGAVQEDECQRRRQRRTARARESAGGTADAYAEPVEHRETPIAG
jgi:hypothetical protein